ncbi:hypothetical protein [Actinomycetospora sp. TBRC 11914]|uniref:hypothetical protein n=1 Tax=Actinomycetospora sp. TBRC 11914 TaxID=2729387 RepID=UPI00145D9A2B|nr:hypothetical protein [Actinomycetospora sp. TBRC 11914]NMO92803.1 GNAT family N-acetyltransferase [Actinomycetospora sp. TBRC 11914]
MSAESTPTAAAPAAFVEPPELRPATFDDFPAMHRLESRFLTNIFTPDQRRALFEENPLWPRLADRWTVGWVLEDGDGSIVGAVTNVPSPYVLHGEEKIAGNGLAWAVTEEHRGYAALLMDEYFEQDEADFVISSNVGVGATTIWQAYGTRVPRGDWARAAYVVTNRRSFTREVLAMKGIPLAGALAVPGAAGLAVKEGFTSRKLAPAPEGFEVVKGRGFDDRFDAFWEELRAQQPDVLLAVRDRATLEWHYGIPLRAGRLWVYTAEQGGRIRAFCVVREYTRPSGMRSMKIVDFQSVEPSVDLLPGLARAAAARCAGARIGMLEHNGCDIPKMAGFDEVAPYRITKAAWSFYYRTTDPDLADTLAHPDVWDPSEYDGDASFM